MQRAVELESWRSGESIELTRNDRYWNPDYRARAKSVTLKFLNDTSALTSALIAGEVDGAYEIPPAAIPRLSKSTTGKVHFGPSTQYVELMAARPDGAMADVKLREALFGVVDREGLAKAVFNGAATPNYTLLSTNSWDPEAKDVWQSAYAPYQEAGRLDDAAAKKLVDASGYDGTPLKFITLSGDVTQRQIAQVVQQQAQAIGVKIQIEALQPTQYSEVFLSAKAREPYDLGLAIGFNSLPDPVEPVGFFVMPESFYNFTNYENPEVAELVTQAKQTLDAKERSELMVKAQEIYERDHVATSLLNKHEVMYLSNRLSGATTSITYLFEPSLAKIGAAG